MDLHYAKIYTPNVMAKMAGFENSRQYFIPRSQIDPFHVDDDGIKAMARSVFPLIDDEDFVKGIQQVSWDTYGNDQFVIKMTWWCLINACKVQTYS